MDAPTEHDLSVNLPALLARLHRARIEPETDYHELRSAVVRAAHAEAILADLRNRALDLRGPGGLTNFELAEVAMSLLGRTREDRARIEALESECAKLRGLVMSLTARVNAQSELLSRRAEKAL